MDYVRILLGRYLLGIGDSAKIDWGVAIQGARIAAAGPHGDLKLRFPGAPIYDFSDKIISPGFVNTHNHCYGVLAHGITPQGPIEDFEGFLKNFWWPLVENRIDKKMIDATARWSAWEHLYSGVTTFCDVLEAPAALPGALEHAASALSLSGIRAVLSFEACERISEENGRDGIEENRDFFLTFREHPLLSGLMSIHTTFTCSPDFILQAKKVADTIGSRFHMHLSESTYEPEKCLKNYSKRPVDHYDAIGILDNRVLASQGVILERHEIDLLAESETSIAHVPLSNCEVGGGIAPVVELLTSGVNVGLGTDGYINNFFEVMRGVFLMQKAKHQNPDVMPAKSVFNMATTNGGRALGIDRLGRIEPGAPADIIVIDPVFPTPVNQTNIYDQVILYANPENVLEVFVNGTAVKSGGRMLFLDREALRSAVLREAERLWKGVS